MFYIIYVLLIDENIYKEKYNNQNKEVLKRRILIEYGR